MIVLIILMQLNRNVTELGVWEVSTLKPDIFKHTKNTEEFKILLISAYFLDKSD